MGCGMSAKNNTHPTAATVERARQGTAAWQASTSPYNDTTPAPLGQAVKIADFLSNGEAHAIPLRHLRELLHLPARTVRLMIRQERLSGVPILESSRATGGYFLPDSDHERARCVQSMRRRAAEIVKVADAIERGAQ